MKRILVVDDIKDYLFQIASILEEDYDILTAMNLEQAKERIKVVNLAIVDIVLDEKEEENNKDGLVLLQWIKKNYPQLPVIIMSPELRCSLFFEKAI
jgi:DNA-binding NtrC family response regulator